MRTLARLVFRASLVTRCRAAGDVPAAVFLAGPLKGLAFPLDPPSVELGRKPGDEVRAFYSYGLASIVPPPVRYAGPALRWERKATP